MREKGITLWVNGKRSNCFIAFIITLIASCIIFFIWRPIYYINDDWIIRDILSGRYSGVPDAHIYNLIYPFSWGLMKLYQIFLHCDIWGGYLCGMMLVCFFLILWRTFELFPQYKLISTICISLIYVTVSLYGIIFFTFTITGAMCGITALFWIVTEQKTSKVSENIIPFILLVLSFCTRKDTFLMCIPFIVVWWGVNVIKEKSWKYTYQIGFKILFLAISIFLLYGIHIYNYKSDTEWKDFLEFRSLRKAVHDYDGYPSWDSSCDFYESIGISYEEYDVFKSGSVNTAFDFSQDIRTILSKVAEYNRQNKSVLSLKEQLKNGFLMALKRVFMEEELFKYLSIFMGITFVMLLIRYKNSYIAVAGGIEILVFFTELAYLGYKGRFTKVVINMLVALLVYFILALDMLLIRSKQQGRQVHIAISEKGTRLSAIFITVSICCLLQLSNKSVMAINAAARDKENNVIIREMIDEYCVTHSDSHFFEPAISISGATYELKSLDKRFNNLIVLGGWNFSSPEYEQIMHEFGIKNSSEIEAAIINRDNIFIISNEYLIEVIKQYFKWKYGDILRCRIVDNIEYINVYSFTLDN
ncbi:MAG: hypothetical protein HFI29_11045 [Lachnospiraceae bacterium]|jgi:hypothetical protein|nr:hypothetical protein [Lachnospiraceae bacterium]